MTKHIIKLGKPLATVAPEMPNLNTPKNQLNEGLEIKTVPPEQPKIKKSK